MERALVTITLCQNIKISLSCLHRVVTKTWLEFVFSGSWLRQTFYIEKYMHIIITGVHMEITDAIRTYTLEKMKMLEKYTDSNDTSGKLQIELSRTSNHHVHGPVFLAEAQLHVRGKEVTLKTTQEDLYKAIDTLKDMLARELAQHKDKSQSLFRRSAHQVKNLFKKLT